MWTDPVIAAFPGTKVWKACRARAVTVKYLTKAAGDSKAAMAAGKVADCLLDAWVEEILAAKAYEEGKHTGAERPNLIVREYTNHEMALVLLSFIFASQGASVSSRFQFLTHTSSADAMSSSITFAFQYMADYPEILAKVREEQYRVRDNDVDTPVTLDLLDEMPYIQAVTKEVLRLRPPVIMVPYLVKKSFPLTDEYTVPAGTMLM